uniref:AAA domain-containing protein n=1 Tax=Pyramimonas obovata TaxID=1411642 RepID=A0A7S0WTS4_9CHLO|mmetsp:Transcript_39601/g.86286  ORF Transcript_39601/g.86286 Transcript_39601/m.86286 type:complete len:397 (+) Transcript_39601:125-1315(+)|eukprot:CAMPEP_0118930386 /NCGR_PEP_ID=MMETSP1169-20130426/7094_1 /TAXON_ID=36882 /ORGANISM="Pyramimonas obovata, Strain CCMP722" /LENGTH=396 /DNA_ID=CAMNT_0006872733 /DNA_START=98 /DNA_END=1288 /DNA_ORIENTATION=+
MPATHSIVFANNKGGSGKTFLLFQLACETARANPDRKVLVLDFSLYSDTSGLFMGGLHREKPLDPTIGLNNTVNKTTPETRAEGLVKALIAAGDQAGAPSTSGHLFGAWFAPKKVAQDVDLSRFYIQPNTVNPRVPSNLYLVASASDESWGSQHTGNPLVNGMDIDIPFWARQHSTEWVPAAQQLNRAIANLPGEWVVFADTDHLASSPLTKLALGAMDRTVVPLSLDQGDFSRLFHDVTGNALFKDVMMPMAEDGLLSAKLSMLIFTKMTSRTNQEVVTEAGIRSPFTPARAAQAQMGTVAASFQKATESSIPLQQTIRGYAETEPEARPSWFAGKYFTAFKTVSDVSLDISKHYGAPICTMDCDDGTLGIDAAVVTPLRGELVFLRRAILEEDH